LAGRLSKTTESLFPGERPGSPTDPGGLGKFGFGGFSVAMFSFYRGWALFCLPHLKSPYDAMQQFIISRVNLELTTDISVN
jgi:hypothetical protein